MTKRDARHLDHKTLEEIRIRAVEQVQSGESPEDVIRTLGFSRSCIYTWLARYRAGGWGALKAKALLGRPMKIKAHQMKWLYQAVTQHNPLQYRFEFALWTRDMIQVLLRERFGLGLSLSSVGRLLRQLGVSCQRPLFHAFEQDPSRVEAWKRDEFPAIQALAKQQNAEIWFGDESGLRSDYHAGTTWGAKGRTPVVPHTGNRFSLNMLSVVNARGQLRFMVHEGRLNGAVFVEFLNRLMYQAPRPIFLVLDGHSAHRSRLVRDYVQSLGGRLRLFFLPPYSPELNPDEQVWNHVKHHGVGRMFAVGKGHLRALIQAKLRRLQKSPWLVRSFFLLPDTHYAAA
jgi:transposase